MWNDHYRDYPSDRAIAYEDYVLRMMEDRFGEPTVEEVQLEAARRAKLAAEREDYAKEYMWVEGKDGFFHKVMKNEAQS